MDAGNYEGKVVGPYGAISFKTNVTEITELKEVQKYGEDDMTFKIDGKLGFAGTIAKYETPFGSSTIRGETKVHWFTKVRVLLSVYRYMKHFKIDAEKVAIVIGQPFKTHTDSEKTKLKAMLEGSHPIEVNGEALTIDIVQVGVAPEGVGAYWSSQKYDTCRLADVGSGTINLISVTDYFVINRGSDTFNFGTETLELLEQVATGVIQNSTNLQWDQNDRVLVCGGSAGVITEILKEHYPNAEILMPKLITEEVEQVLEPKYANAVGFYTLALGNFK